MSRILLAWELGTGFGHLGPFLGLAPKLLERGHELHIAAREIAGAVRAVGDLPITVHQAPLCLNTYGGLQEPPLNYAEILMRYGYLEPAMLKAMLTAWQALLRATAADILVADHAPTALLAARLHDLPRAVIGSAFNAPMPANPSPSMRSWITVPRERLVDSDQRVLRVINAVVPSHRRLPALLEVFDGVSRFLSGVPELDPHGARDPRDYLGLHTVSTGSAAPLWPEGDGPRVFFYLHADYRHAERAMQALAASRVRALVHVLGQSDTLRSRFASAGVNFAPDLLDMTRVVAECDFCICHGNVGTTLGMLAGGKPVLALPKQLENFLQGKAVERIGAGLVVHPDAEEPDIAGALAAMLKDTAFAGNARALADRYGGESVGTMADRAVARLEALAARAAGPQQ